MPTNEATENRTYISRDWRKGLTEYAVIGFIYNTDGLPWFVETGHTASGAKLESTDEEMTVDSFQRFATDKEALEWSKANGYR